MHIGNNWKELGKEASKVKLHFNKGMYASHLMVLGNTIIRNSAVTLPHKFWIIE